MFLSTTHNDGQLMWELFVKFKGTCNHIHVQTYLYFWFFAQDHLAWCFSTVLFHRMILYLQMVKCKRWLWISQRPHTTLLGTHYHDTSIHITRISNSISSGDTSPLHMQDEHATDLIFYKALKVDIQHAAFNRGNDIWRCACIYEPPESKRNPHKFTKLTPNISVLADIRIGEQNQMSRKYTDHPHTQQACR